MSIHIYKFKIYIHIWVCISVCIHTHTSFLFHKIDKADCQGFEPHRSWASLNNSEDDWFSLRFLCVPKAVCLVKAMVFPIVMYRYESWIIKKAECQRIDAFELWYRRRLLRIPWTLRRWNQSVLKKINPEYSLKGLLLNLKLQSFGHLIWRANSLEKADAGKDWR